ncbi:bacteriophage abortive infection AbiH family protein [Enterobacter cloacae]|uniref:bacteriophage abortive infection AbiH family protein n=1 Tax=Enterobacter cloacae TaxID=550 RepID=UPI002003EE4F|nr:bacteriophage abortive infection AbiH family protein [Enterobacter cloacae]MCK7268778.1 bacteriophage abortive infection AbiH family protein [Enterobacter cloacae]
MKLYITGNGFDLHHGLKTSYFSFGYFLRNHHAELYELLIDFLSFTDLPKYQDQLNTNDHPLWSDFENSLSGLDSEFVLDSFTEYLPNISDPHFRDRDWHSFEIEIKRILDKLTDGLFEKFRDFISQVKYPPLAMDKRLRLCENSFFINFNYTNTIEHYYKIDSSRILYIHGIASTPETPLVLGHGIDPENFIEPPIEPPSGINNEELQIWFQQQADNYNVSYENGKHVINNYFKHSFKNTEKVISESIEFFKRLKFINEIVIIGHSLSDVDMPYFSAIQKYVHPDCSWTATYYLEKEHIQHWHKLRKLGVNNPMIVEISSLLVE